MVYFVIKKMSLIDYIYIDFFFDIIEWLLEIWIDIFLLVFVGNLVCIRY